MATVNQPSLMPTRKVAAASMGASIAFIISFLWDAFLPEIPLPAEVASGLGAVLAFGLGWMIPEKA